MKKRLSLFSTHLCVGITQDELYGLEEITFPRPVAPNYDIMLWRERFGDSLVLVTAYPTTLTADQDACGGWSSPLETLNYYLLDVHFEIRSGG